MTEGDKNKVALAELTPEQREYRATLIQLEQRSQEAADKTVISLAGGALGVSFAFIQEFVGEGQAAGSFHIALAWGLWVLSLTLVLVSHYISALASRKALKQFDARDQASRVGGGFDWALTVLNPAALTSFIAGLVFAGIFVYKNL